MHMPYTLRIPYTLELSAKTGAFNYCFVSEFDCELVVEYADDENWEIASVRMEQTQWNPEFEISAKSDPTLWTLIERALKHDDKAICEKVLEYIYEDYSDRQAARDDDAAYDRWVESR